MKKHLITALAAIVCLIIPAMAFAHCDTLDGPVVMDAKEALKTGDVTPVLKWVAPKDEQEIKTEFQKTLNVRKMGPEAKELADRYFFQTLVQIHRASENAPFTGLKPAGSVEPSIAAADKALKEGSVDELAEKIGDNAEQAVKEKFSAVSEAKKHKDETVEAGRKYVKLYVQYIHFVEKLHQLITGGIHHGSAE